MKKTLWLLVCVLLTYSAHGQTNVGKLLQQLNDETNDSARLMVYSQLNYYYKYSNPDSAELYLKMGLNDFRKKDYLPGIAAMYMKLGALEVSHSNLQTGYKLLQDAMAIYTKTNNIEGIASTLLEMAPLEAKSNKYELATQHLLKALKIAEERKLHQKITTAYISLGLVNTYTNDLEKSLAYYGKALEILKVHEEVRALCNTYNNIGIVHGMMGNMDSAQYYIDKALKRSNKTELIDVYIYSLMNMAIVYQNKNDNATAMRYLNEALKLARQKKLKSEEVQILINIAVTMQEHNVAAAKDSINKALPIALELGNNELLYDLYINLTGYYESMGDHKKANDILKEHKKISDSLYNVEKTKEIANLQALYELDESNNKLKEMGLMMEADKQRKNVLLVLAVSLIAIVVTVSVYLRKTRNLYGIVSKQKEELSETNKVKDKLFSIIGHDLRGPVGSIATVIDLMNEEDMNETEKKEMLGMLQKQTQYTMATLDTLLLWGKTQIADNQVHMENINAAIYVQNNLNLLQYELKNKRIQLVNETLDNSLVYADKAQFDFVVRNLLTNAVKYSEQGGSVTIGVNNNSNKGYTTLMVKDNGVGMSEAQCNNLFKGFGTTTPGTNNEVGTGIGLMLCHEFVTANGGNIWVECNEGKGTTFYCTFRNV